jgi:hypothetical protein
MIVAAACIEPSEPPPPESSDPAITRTIVTVGQDGSSSVRTEEISRAEQLREQAARAALVRGLAKGTDAPASIAFDGSCAGSSLWLFDGEYLGGNEICFAGSGVADLAQYQLFRCTPSFCFVSSWASSVRSLWAGVDSGDLTNCSRPFTPWERRNTLSAQEQQARWLSISQSCEPH